MTDEDLRRDPSNIDRSKVFTYHFDPSLVKTSPQEISFDQPAPLPAWLVREEFLNKLNACKFLIIKAPIGSGKSTIFPAGSKSNAKRKGHVYPSEEDYY